MKGLKLRDKLCIYGDYYSVLSKECYGCHNYGYICCGPEEGKCPGGIFEYDKYVAYAEYVLGQEEISYNEYLFARLLGETVEELITHLNSIQFRLIEANTTERKSTYERMISDIEKALGVSEEEIESLKREYGLNLNLDELEPIIDKTISIR